MSSFTKNSRQHSKSKQHRTKKIFNVIESNSTNSTGVTLCVPFVFTHITKEKVFAVFRNQRVGHIERIYIAKKDDKHNSVFVYFAKDKWSNKFNANDILANLKAGIPWIVPYSQHGYWKVWISQVEKPEERMVRKQAPRARRKLRLDLSLTSDTVKSDYKETTGESPISTLDLNDPIQARIFASVPSMVC